MRHHRASIFLTLSAVLCLSLAAYAGPPSSPPPVPPGPPPNLTLNVIYSFTNGETPGPGVIEGTNGAIYGVTSTGGTNNLGGVYEVSRSGVLINEVWLNGTTGAAPMAPLIEGPGGNFIGTASRGGVGNNGTVFRVLADGEIQLVAALSSIVGSTPMAPLLLGTNGWLYGTTFNGGTNNLGAVFAITSEDTLTNICSFSGTNGANPADGLIEGTDGNLYGTTQYGGANGLGTVFRLSYAGALTNLGSFSSETGAFPGGLFEDARGNFYGTTINGGTVFAGTIFKLNTANTLETVFEFNINDGANPNSPMTASFGGNWFGTTEEGGSSGMGTIFVLNTNGFVTNLISFDGADGALPRSGMVQGIDGNYYGTTSEGGAYGFGEIYQLTGFAPFIIKPPANQQWVKSGTAQFSVIADGSAPLSYQWLFDSSNIIPGATNATLIVTNEQLINSGTYTVVVSNLYGVVSTSAVLRAAAPTVSVVALPATVSNSSLAISGAAAGPNGVATILYQLNSNGWFAVSGTTHWTTNITLQPGTNTFQVESLDPAGNPSTVKSITIFYATTSTLTLRTNGLGSIVTSFKGTNLTVDRSYTVRANPGSGQLFLSWSGSVSATNSLLTFVMQSNMVVQANFTANPFIAAAGTYDGLFFGADGIAEQSAGLLRNFVLGTAGAYSGQVVIRGVAYGFTGSFDVLEQSSPTVARPDNQGGPLALSLTLNGNELTGTVSGTDGGGWTSTLLAEQAGKSASAEYTLLIPPGPGAPSTSPPGYGYALVTNHNGLVTLSGALADGAAFSQTTPVVGAGDVPFYASLYSNTGLLLGWLNLNGGLTGTNVWWIAPSSSDGRYPSGFTNVFPTLRASGWTNPPPRDLLPSGTLTISNTSLSLDFFVSIANNTLIKEAGSPSNSLAGTLNPRTGLLTISFGNGTGKATTTGYAAILQNSTSGDGYFLTKTNAGAVILQP